MKTGFVCLKIAPALQLATPFRSTTLTIDRELNGRGGLTPRKCFGLTSAVRKGRIFVRCASFEGKPEETARGYPCFLEEREVGLREERAGDRPGAARNRTVRAPPSGHGPGSLGRLYFSTPRHGLRLSPTAGRMSPVVSESTFCGGRSEAEHANVRNFIHDRMRTRRVVAGATQPRRGGEGAPWPHPRLPAVTRGRLNSARRTLSPRTPDWLRFPRPDWRRRGSAGPSPAVPSAPPPQAATLHSRPRSASEGLAGCPGHCLTPGHSRVAPGTPSRGPPGASRLDRNSAEGAQPPPGRRRGPRRRFRAGVREGQPRAGRTQGGGSWRWGKRAKFPVEGSAGVGRPAVSIATGRGCAAARGAPRGCSG